MPPTNQSKKNMEAALPWIHKMPAEIRMDIAHLAARSLAWRDPIPVTRGSMGILSIPGLSADAVGGPQPVEYGIQYYRTREQHQTLQPLLSLCNKTRAAALGKEVFGLQVFGGVSEMIDGIKRDYRPFQLAHDGPQLPMFEGATQDLVLLELGFDVNAAQLFLSLSHIFGAKLRRIHLLNENCNLPEPLDSYTSPETGRVYRFHPGFSHPRFPLTAMTRLRFTSLANGLEAEHLAGHMESTEGEFKDQDAKVFEAPPEPLPTIDMDFPGRGGSYGEIIRQYRGGKTMINTGVKYSLKRDFDCPNAGAKRLLRQIVRLAEGYFPDFEYISVCGQIGSVRTNVWDDDVD